MVWLEYRCYHFLSFKRSWYILRYSEAVIRKCFVKRLKKSVLKHFAKFIGKLLCRSLFSHKLASRFEKRLQHRCCSVNFARFFRTPILYNIFERLLLVLVRIGLVRRLMCCKFIDFLHHCL